MEPTLSDALMILANADSLELEVNMMLLAVVLLVKLVLMILCVMLK